MPEEKQKNNSNNAIILAVVLSIIIGTVFGGAAGYLAGSAELRKAINNWVKVEVLKRELSAGKENEVTLQNKLVQVNEESAIIKVAEEASPAVVSVIVSKDLPTYEQYFEQQPNPMGDEFFRQFFGDQFNEFFNSPIPQYRQKGTEKREIGGGSGFIVSPDGYIITNKHVVYDEAAAYTVVLNDDRKFDAKVLARDPISDIAVLKIEATDLPSIELGDSSNLKVGQFVIAIGNALGEFSNTVSVGVISGLSRSVTAGGNGMGNEQLIGVIQTDASINPGNSGGPLLNLAGQAIGINTAMAYGAENIGFAIPANEIKNIYESVKQYGKIVRPWLGVRYVIINKDIAAKNNLNLDYGALILRGEDRTELAVVPGSPADVAGIAENDIILEINNEKISENNPLIKIISKYKPGDEVTLKIMSKGQEKDVKIKLTERNTEIGN